MSSEAFFLVGLSELVFIRFILCYSKYSKENYTLAVHSHTEYLCSVRFSVYVFFLRVVSQLLFFFIRFSFNLLPVRFRVGFLFFGPTLLCICSYLSQLNIVAGARVACLCCFLFVVLHQQDNSLHSACIRSSALCMSFVFTLFFSTSLWSSVFFLLLSSLLLLFLFQSFSSTFHLYFFFFRFIFLFECVRVSFSPYVFCVWSIIFSSCVYGMVLWAGAPQHQTRGDTNLCFSSIFSNHYICFHYSLLIDRHKPRKKNIVQYNRRTMKQKGTSRMRHALFLLCFMDSLSFSDSLSRFRDTDI